MANKDKLIDELLDRKLAERGLIEGNKEKNQFNPLVTQIFLILIGVLIGYFLFNNKDPNYKLTYGETGYPKNCRAIIKSNYEGWYLEDFTAEEALDSINRNCGEFGYSWDQD